MRPVNISREVLEEIYLKENNSIRKTAQILGVAVGTAYNYLKKYGIKTRISGKNIRYYKEENVNYLSPRFREIVDGVVISDGYIGMRKRKITDDVGCLTITQSIKHRDFLEFIKKELESVGIESKIIERNHHKEVYLYTRWYSCFAVERKRWYPKGKKEIPKDLVITPKMLAIWYMGDGSLFRRREGKRLYYGLILATHSFSFDDNLYLANILKKKYNLHFNIYRQKSYYYLSMTKRSSIKKFIDIVEPYIVNSFRYKIEL